MSERRGGNGAIPARPNLATKPLVMGLELNSKEYDRAFDAPGKDQGGSKALA